MRYGMSRRSRLRRLLTAALLAGVASGCASLLGPRSFTVSEAQLRERLAAQFPVDRRLLELLDLHMAEPRVSLKPDLNRIEVAFDLRLDERLSRRSFPTTIALDTALFYDPAQAAVRMVDVRMRSLRVDGLPVALAGTLETLGAPLAEQLLEGTPVYRFTPEQLRNAEGRGYRPESRGGTPPGRDI
jgi:hypothetical protein